MNKTRRMLLLAVPAGALLGLTGCVGSGSPSDSWDFDNAPADGEGLWVVANSDPVFLTGSERAQFVPQRELLQACVNDEMLYIQLWQGIENLERTVSLRVRARAPDGDYLDSLQIDLADLGTDDALVAVVARAFDSETGLGAYKSYEYRLQSGRLTIQGLAAFNEGVEGLLSLTFEDAVGSPTPVNYNVATSNMQLAGSVDVQATYEQVSDYV